MDYLKYWTPVAVLAASFAGLIAGGNWVWVGIASFPCWPCSTPWSAATTACAK